MKEQELCWGMHFCNASMFKKILNREESIHYYMTEYGQVFKFNKEKFKSYELDLQNMVWFQNQDFVRTYLGDNVKYTEIKKFADYYDYR